MKLSSSYFGVAVLAILSAVGLSGCGGGGGGGSSTPAARATIVLSNDSAVADAALSTRDSGNGHVPVEDILSLMVSITSIQLQQCGDGDTEHGADEEEDIHVSDSAFDPTCVTIEQGGTVTWEWDTNTLHTITSGSPGDEDAGSLFDESSEGADSTVKLVFDEPGMYPYFSNTEGDIAAGMAGTVKVVPDDDEDDPNDDDHHNGEEDRSENHNDDHSGEGGPTTTVYEGAFDVNLLDLSALSEVLTNADVPAGKYCRIILQIENPRLVLVSDPDTVITDIQLTADGRLFIKDRFEVAEGDDILIVLNFGGIHLILNGDGGYVLTPKVRADVNPDEEHAQVEGEITSIDTESRIVEIEDGDGGTFEVMVTDDTVIKTDDDADDAEETRHDDDGQLFLKFEDLQVGQHVQVEGTFSEGGQVLADVIIVGDDSFDSPTEIEFSGEILSIDPETQIIEVQTSEDTIQVQVNDDTEIKSDEDGDDEVRTDGGEWVYLKFEDLTVGMHVDVEGLQSDGDPVRAREIEVADEDFTSPVVVEFYGEIASVDTEGHTVQVTTDSTTYTLAINDDTTIKTDDDADDEVRTSESNYLYLKFEDLAAGQHVNVRGYLVDDVVRTDRIVIDDADYETPAE